jgi:hypothetical protein
MVSSVDLPDPLGPITTTSCPAPTSRLTSRSACTLAAPSPYTLDTCRISSVLMVSPWREFYENGHYTCRTAAVMSV